jgi:hypothetical protein
MASDHGPSLFPKSPHGIPSRLLQGCVGSPLEIEKGYAGPNGVIAAQFSKLHRLVSSLARQNCVDVF